MLVIFLKRKAVHVIESHPQRPIIWNWRHGQPWLSAIATREWNRKLSANGISICSRSI